MGTKWLVKCEADSIWGKPQAVISFIVPNLFVGGFIYIAAITDRCA